MALIVEDGSIVTNADSYISVDNATTFINDYLGGEYEDNAAAFLGLSSSRQEQVLRKAAWYLDMRYRTRWKGYKRFQSQSLDWPRTDVQDEDDYDLPEDEIPRRLIRAQVEIACLIAGGIAIFENREHGGLVQSEKVDVIAVSYFQSAPAQTLFEELEATLKGLLKNTRRIIRA